MSKRAYIEATEQNFDEVVIKASHDRPVLIDYWADWCSPCLVLAPVLERVLEDYEDELTFGKVEVDENMRLAGRYKLRGFPTVILYKDGEEKARFHGAQPAHVIREFLDEHL